VSAALPAELVARLAEVRSVGVVTGAGVSAESGIRTYRGRGGLYDDPEEGGRTVEALSAEGLAHDPDRTWRVVADLARAAVDAEPNAAHRAIVDIERAVARFVLLTQNVDGLHQRAGSRNVIDIHGDVLDVRCMACGGGRRLDARDVAELVAAPRCPTCGGTLRPDAVLFGELLPVHKVERLTAELIDRVPDLVVIAGTTGVFPYIAEPLLRAAGLGRLTVEVDPEPTAISDVVDHALRGKAGDYLPAIARALARRGSER